MSTTSFNGAVAGVISAMGHFSTLWKVTHASFPVAQGDLVFLGSGIAKPVTADGDAAALLGVALDPSGPSSNLDNSTAPATKAIMVGAGIIWNLNTTASETYSDDDKVYVGADAQTITNVAGLATNYVGVVKLPSNVTSITGASGVKVPILVFCRKPFVFKE